MIRVFEPEPNNFKGSERLMKNKKICIIGLGYIGLPTAAMFATHGFDILGVDVNPKVVEELNQGRIIIEEPYLDIMVQAAVTSGKLTARSKPDYADVFIIAVPTPINEDKTADMTYVKSAAESIVPYLREGNIVVLESTSPPGTVNELLLPILEKSGLKCGEQILVAHCPERVLPGRILIELVENNRIIGGINKASAEAVKELYKTFVRGNIYITDATTAEMCKLMENTFRDVNIALANELAMLCEKMGINAWEVIQLANKHPRVNLHSPGPGVGGHCLAVDPWFIVEKFPDTAKIIELSRKINDGMPHYVKDKIMNLTQHVQGKRVVAILGITYKADVDDIRESPIIELISILRNDNVEVRIVDPFVENFCGKIEDVYEACEGAHLVVLGVNHKQFEKIDFNKVSKLMAKPQVLDTRNFWDEKQVCEAGLVYHLLGRG